MTVLTGDCREELSKVAAQSVQCCVTSPPYWGLRSYLPKGHPLKVLEIGQERTPQDYVNNLRAVFGGKENPVGVWRALRNDGTLWLNLGDSYAAQSKNRTPEQATRRSTLQGTTQNQESILAQKSKVVSGLKAKDLVGIPWLVAFALRADGWYLRSDIIWAKPNCMPESVTDRPTRSHEYLFLLTKAPRYFYDAEAIKEACSESFLNDSRHRTGPTDVNEKNGYAESKAQNPKSVHRLFDKQRGHGRRHQGFNERWDNMERAEQSTGKRNKRDVWRVSPANYPDAHFATFPPELITPCILAGSKPGDTVLDPFGGSGTTAQVALEYGRRAVICELNADYVPLIKSRTDVTPGLALA